MHSAFNRLLLTRLSTCYTKRNESIDFNYDLREEIIVSNYKNIMIIGINLPQASNSLSDHALIKLNDRFKQFNNNDQFSVVVLHGIGGNLCTGLQNPLSRDKAEAVISTIFKLRKPTVVNITGFTHFFGFQLAMMCDFRIMETNAVFGLGHKKEKDEIFPVVCEKLIALTSIGTALDVVLTGASLSATESLTLGLINRCCDCGAGLGKALNFASGISKYPIERIIKERDFIYSFGKIKKN